MKDVQEVFYDLEVTQAVYHISRRNGHAIKDNELFIFDSTQPNNKALVVRIIHPKVKIRAWPQLLLLEHSYIA